MGIVLRLRSCLYLRANNSKSGVPGECGLSDVRKPLAGLGPAC